MKYTPSLLVAIACCTSVPFSLRASNKLSEDERIDLLRGMTAEYATVKSPLPRSKKPLIFDAAGTWDKEKWEEARREFGPAARVGDLVQVTHLTIAGDRLVLEINGGMKRKGHWYDHVEVGMGRRTSPINQNPDSNAASGTEIAVVFDKHVPALKPVELKKILAPVLDFEKHSVTENYVETLPAPVQAAIKEKKVIEGMDRDQVLLAMGRPRHKERTARNGAEVEDWIYGDPPGKITFVTFDGAKVVKVREAYADVGGATAAPLPPP